MSGLPTLLLTAAAVALAPGRPAPADGSDPGLAVQGLAILKTYCYRCHGRKFEVPEFDVTRRDVLVGPSEEDKPYVTPGKPDLSLIWERVGVKKNMPPKKEAQRPTEAEAELLRRWIDAGLEFPTDAPAERPFKSVLSVQTAIRDDLRKAARSDRPFRRYFTLTNYWNDKTVGETDLRSARAALSKMMNSLSWERDVVVPRSVDEPDGTIFAVDLRDLGWDRDGLWRKILAANRYGLALDSDGERELREVAAEVYQLADTKVPALRADWFLASASRPPLYETILDLPDTALALQKLLKVNVAENFKRQKVARAGFSRSGVSSQNRVVERHATPYGAYWQSFDFRPGNPRGNIFRDPLGPDSDDSPFKGHAFRPDGGEVIFNLPNGLQAYLLVNGKGKRISEAPADVVQDPAMSAGSTQIVNGLSCIVCHKRGMMDDLKDEVRTSHALDGQLAERVEAIYPERRAMAALVKRDKDRFLKALAEATAPFLNDGDSGAGGDEPIGSVVASRYLSDVTPSAAALELGLQDAAELRAAIRSSDDLRRLGLGPLAEGQSIKREEWEARDRSNSLFHEAALVLRRGTPIQ